MTSYAIELNGIHKAYPHFALNDLNLRLPQGCVMGLIGPNGAGKSTTIRIMMGLIHQDAGQATVLGQPMPAQQAIAKRDIGFMSEDMRLYGQATLAWHAKFLQSIYPSWDQGYAETLCQRFNLEPQQRIKGLSHGQRIKAALLLVFARRPKLLILDEPTTGLDPVARREVISELMAVMEDEERSILFSSHNTQDVEQISDLITFIDQGEVVESNDRETFLDQWRRIRMEAPSDAVIPAHQGDVCVDRSGQSVVVTTRQFQPDVSHDYEKAGATVKCIEPMTLEEIFLASVAQGRSEETS